MPDTENIADLHRANAELRERVALLEASLREQERIVANFQLAGERERYLLAILETTQDGFLEMDADMKIVDANEAYCRMSGYTKAELLKMHMYDLDAVETVQETQERCQRIIANSTECFEARHRRKDGSLLDIEVSVTCLNRNQGNWKIFGFCRDITERKRAEQVIRESESLYRSILKASPDIITITDLKGRVRAASPSGLKVFGYAHEEEVLGRLITDFLISEDRERARYNIALMYQGIFTGVGEYQGVRPDGVAFHIETNGEFIRDQAGQPAGMIFIARDITGRKQTEKKLQEASIKLERTVRAC